MSEVTVDVPKYLATMRGEAENCALRGDYAMSGLLVGAAKLIETFAPKPPPAETEAPPG